MNNTILREPLWLFGVVLIGVASFWPDSQILDLKRALSGWSPADYTKHILNPAQFSQDWHTGIKDAYQYSLPMQFFLWSEQYLGIDSEVLLKPYAWCQWIFFLFSVGFLTKAIFEDKSIALICVVITAASPLVGMNLANFGHGFTNFNPYLYYNFTNGFRFTALAFLLRSQYFSAAIFFGIGFYCHALMAMIGVCFAYFHMLFNKTQITHKKLWWSLLVLGCVALPAIAIPLINTEGASIESIPNEQWTFVMRLMSYHWFPVSLGYFNELIWKYTLPLFYLLGLFYFTWRYFESNQMRHKIIFWGVISSIILTACGIIISETSTTPFLIRLSLHRASDLLSFISMMYITAWLVEQTRSGGLFIVILSSASIISILFSLPELALALLLLSLLMANLHNAFLNKRDILLLISFVIAVVWSILHFHQGISEFISENDITIELIEEWQIQLSEYWYEHISPSSTLTYYYFLIPLTFFLRLTTILKPSTSPICNFLLITALSVTLFQVMTMNQSEWLLKHEAKSSSLKDVQIWLKDHTTLDSLFMANPAYSRGWREYSERSYFGSIQEWVGTPNLYVAKRKVFHQGLERLKIFGIDLNNITAEEVKQSNKNLYLKEMQRIVHKKFLDLNSSRISNLHTEYGVDYIILNKNHWHKKELNLPIAYENRHYKILSLNPNR